ncbi:MAG: hypothetical protein AAF787_07040 [Chloroflexota bacterium]
MTNLEELEQEFEDEIGLNEPTLDTVDVTIRNYVVVAVALSIATWDIAFNYGVYGVVFYHRYFIIWVICTATLLAALLLPQSQRPIGFWGALAIMIPSIWLVLILVLPGDAASTHIALRVTRVIVEIVTILTLPYISYLLLVIFQPQAIHIPWRLLLRLFAVIIAIGILGYVIGSNNHLFITCGDFEISGQDIPTNCRE